MAHSWPLSRELYPTSQLFRRRESTWRRLDQWQARPIPGTEDALQPFFSPDGNWLGFLTLRGLKKVNLAGGEPVELCECSARYGASWGPDDKIIFADMQGGLFRVSASGGKPKEITLLDEEAGEVSHRLPHILPNGKAVLFTALRHKAVALDWKRCFFREVLLIVSSNLGKHHLTRIPGLC